MIKFNRLLLVVAVTAFFFTSCKKDDPPLPDNTLQFEASEQGIANDETTTTVSLKLSRSTDASVAVSVGLTEAGVAYGTDYTTTPAASAGKIALTIPAGSSEVSFTVAKTAGVLFDGDEDITFAISSAASPVVIGTVAQLKLSFDEILSAQAALNIDGGGATYPNKVFIDLSANRQTPILRTGWDLGFYSGAEFRVLLNSSTAMMAKMVDKNDLTQVTAADTVGFAAELTFNAFLPSNMAHIDDPEGDLSLTAIDAVAAADADNKVYIINRGTGISSAAGVPAPARGWKKIRVLQTATGYKLQYADIDATTFSEIEVPKDGEFNFNYVQFEDGLVDVEPAKDRWDLAWTYFTNSTYFGPEPIPYGFQDMIIQNRNGVEAVEVVTSTKTYADFAEADIAGLAFSASQTTIGSNWRVATQGVPAAVLTDRFYIVKDPAGNYYKLKFTALTENGERGKPAIEYALIKQV